MCLRVSRERQIGIRCCDNECTENAKKGKKKMKMGAWNAGTAQREYITNHRNSYERPAYLFRQSLHSTVKTVHIRHERPSLDGVCVCVCRIFVTLATLRILLWHNNTQISFKSQRERGRERVREWFRSRLKPTWRAPPTQQQIASVTVGQWRRGSSEQNSDEYDSNICKNGYKLFIFGLISA